MTTLALDLGQTIGWVKGSTVGPIEFGSFAMTETTDLGLWLQGADTFLMKAMEGVTDIAVEQPFLGESYYPARKLLGLLGHVYYHARYKGIAGALVNEIPVPTAKLALAGHGRAEKEDMIAAACEFMGWEASEIDEHVADACAIWRVHLFGERLPARRKPKSSPGRSILRGPALR